MKTANTPENKAKFLYQNLKSQVVGDFSRYILGTPKNGLDVKAIPGHLNGINKNDFQQFDVDFDLKDGFEFYNCFGDLCRHWSHTIHAENLTVVKKPLSQISDQDSEVVRSIMHWPVANKSVAQTIVLLNDRMFPCVLADYLRSKGYLIGWLDLTADDILSYGWCKFEVEG